MLIIDVHIDIILFILYSYYAAMFYGTHKFGWLKILAEVSIIGATLTKSRLLVS